MSSNNASLAALGRLLLALDDLDAVERVTWETTVKLPHNAGGIKMEVEIRPNCLSVEDRDLILSAATRLIRLDEAFEQ